MKYIDTIIQLLFHSTAKAYAVTDDYHIPSVNVTDPSSVNMQTVVDFIVSVVNLLIKFAGVLCLVLVIYASITYALAYGDEAKIEAAKKTLTWAFIGLIIVALATWIVVFATNVMATH